MKTIKTKPDEKNDEYLDIEPNNDSDNKNNSSANFRQRGGKTKVENNKTSPENDESIFENRSSKKRSLGNEKERKNIENNRGSNKSDGNKPIIEGRGNANKQEAREPDERIELSKSVPFTDEELNDVEEEQQEQDKSEQEEQKKSATSDNLANLLPFIIDKSISGIGVFAGSYWDAVPLDTDEKEAIKNAFSDAYPDAKINPKLEFFGMMFIVFGSRVKFNQDKK